MLWKISDKTAEIGRSLYIYGLVGVGTQLFSLRLDKITGIPVEISNLQTVTLAGLLGLALAFKTVAFVFRVWDEYNEAKIALLKEQVEKVAKAASAASLVGVLTSEASLQPLAKKISEALTSAEKRRRHLAVGDFIGNFVAPLSFAAVSLTVLLGSTMAFATELAIRIWRSLF